MRVPTRKHGDEAVDEAVDLVLSHLRSAQPSAGFAARLHSAIEQSHLHRGLERSTRRRKMGWKAWLWRLPAGALACAALGMLALLFLRLLTPEGRRGYRIAKSYVDLSAPQPESRAMPGNGSPLRSGSSPAVLRLHVSTEALQSKGVPGAGDPGAMSSAAHFDQLAASEAAAPTHPAPPLPTTTEEVAIRRFTQRHKAYDLAALAPSRQLLQEHEELKAFQEFFAPPPELSGNLPLETTMPDEPAAPTASPATTARTHEPPAKVLPQN